MSRAVELEEIRTGLEHHKSEAAAVRDRATSSAQLEEELRAAIEEVERAASRFSRDARDAADTATRKFGKTCSLIRQHSRTESTRPWPRSKRTRPSG